MAASAQVLVRRAEAEDVEWVSSLASAERGLLRQRFGEFDVAQLIEQSFLSITALNDRGEVVGFATFSDAPAGPSADEAGGAAWLQWFRTKHGDDSTWLSNHIWLSFFVAHKSYALDAAESICRTVFTTLPETDAALLALPRAVDIFAPLNSSFEEVAAVTGDGGAAADAAAALPGADAFNKTTVYRCERAAFIPNLTIRAARVEDHDDLVPVFNTQSEVLTDLYGEFYLAELIEAQDPTNRALVSEVDGRACGLMALTTDMQLDVLQRCFELDAYNNLLKRTRAELAADAEAQRVALRERSDWLAQLHSHASELSATFDALSHADDPDRVNLAEFEAAFNRRGEEWGFIANRGGRGLGSVMVRDLQLAGDATQREVLNEAVEVYAEEKAAARKARNVHAWYSLHNGREVVFKAFSTAAAFEEKEAAARGEGAPPPEDEAEEEERLAAARVALGDLAALVGMLVRESGAKYLGENVGDELLDLLGLDDVAVADKPDDAEAKGAESAGDADAEGESKDGAPAGESKAAGDAGESKGEAKGGDAGADGDNGDDADGDDAAGEGGDATSDAGADDAEEPIVRVSHAQVVTALDAFEATIRATQSVRLALLGGPGAGKKTVAKALASKLGLAVLNFGNLLADARYRADSEAQAAEDNDEEAVDKAAVVRAAVAERLQSEDCNKGWVFVNVPGDDEVVGTILSDLRAAQLETVPVVLAAGDRLARHRRFGGSEPSEKEEEDYVQASVSWRRKGDAVIAAAAGGASHVARVDANAAPEAVLQSVLDELSDAHLLPTPFEQDEADSEPLPEDESAPEHAESNAFAVTLFCLDELFDSRARDFLDHAFAMFPDREYCILTLPHSSMETPLLQQFWQVPARPESTFSHTLYILHRASLPSQGIVSVRPARVSDHLAIKDMVSGLARGAALMDAVAAAGAGAGADGGDSKEADAGQRGTAFVAECQGQVVGVCVMSRSAVSGDHLTTLRHKFDLECFLSMHQYQGGDFSALDHLVMNPVFTNTTSYVIRRCMRLHKCCVVMFRKGVAEAIPPAVAELFVQVRPRRATAPPALAVPGTAAYAEALDDGPAPGSGAGGARNKAASAGAVGDSTDDPSHPGFSLFGLFFLSRRLTSEPKLVVNSRVVVAGASDTSLALLEAMLTRPYLTFTNLVLVSPGGLPRAGPNRSSSDPSAWCIESQYSPEDLARLAFDARVRVVDARVVDIDRESRGIVVSGDGVMHYDRLVIATGLADHTASRAVVDLNDEGLVGSRVFSIAACLNNPSEPQAPALERAAQAAAASNPDVDPPVLVYGQSLDALCAIQALLSRGVRPTLIRQLVPPARRGSLDHEHVRTFVDNAVVDLGIDILYDATLVEATSATDGSVHVVVDMGADGADAAAAAPSSRKVVATQLLLCADRKNVDPTIFRAINGCGLVYDGRLVLNHRFRTTQQEIFGAGPIAKFSRRYRSKHLLQDFNSREVGAAVATSLLQELDPLALPSVDDVPEEYATGPAVLPKFGLPCVSRGVLPGGLQYLDVCLPEVDVGDGAGRELDTRGGTDEAPNYCHVTVDRHGRLARLTYVGGGSVETSNLVTLVGRHTSFLNGLVRDYDAGHIADLVSFFRGDWAQALYHDRFDSMVMELRDMLLDDAHVRQVVAQVSEAVEGGKSQEEISGVRNAAVGAQGSALPPSTRRTVETHVLEFLRANRKLLPMYFLPGVGGARVGSRGVVR